ncbi:MAG TPA: hypothetical protein VEJ18_04650 [Planctomycetota bacterium]|nr:hypothetical protein [Planctomycetota bacterium]
MSRLWIPFIVATAATAAEAQEGSLGARARWWRAELSGDLRADGDRFPGTTIDVDNELGLDDRTEIPEIQAWLEFPFIGRIVAGYWWADVDGERTLTRSVTFEDITFSTSERVDTELELDVFYAHYQFLFPSLPVGPEGELQVGVLAGLRVVRAEASIDSSFRSVQDSGIVGLPVVGAGAALELFGWLRAEAELLGLTFSYSDVESTYFEASLELTSRFGPAFAGVGYKFASADVTVDTGDDEFNADVELKGLYFTAGLRF